jgi:DNA repair protein RecN (Recombination protein N)
MLKELRIKNLAIIGDLTIGFGSGLNVLTGETGAGKSIIFDALSLALGSKAQSGCVRSGAKEAVVQAYFDLEAFQNSIDFEIDISDGLILRRSIFPSGRTRAYINDAMVSLPGLLMVGKALVDIHGQHEHQSLLSIDNHRAYIDTFARLHEECRRLEAVYKEVEMLKREAKELKQKAQERFHRIDLLRFQIQEIDSASLKAGERDDLQAEINILSHVSKLKELAEAAYSLLYGAEDSCTDKLSSIIKKIKEMHDIDKDVYEILRQLESVYPSIEDAAISMRTVKDKYEPEPEKLAALSERVGLIETLEKKYGGGIENILQFRQKAEQDLEILEHAEERYDMVEHESNEKQKLLSSMAYSLSEKRKDAARKVEKLMQDELRGLAFNDAKFLIDIREEQLSSHGVDRVEFLFSANPGEPPKPLVRIASGGELSRVMLALKSILADFDNTPVLVFDEVDAGIGGRTAHSVGNKLRRLSDKHQVLCTTHLPQIASLGDFHVKTVKTQQDDRVHVLTSELSGEERLQEIARMLSGTITEASLRHAKEMLRGAV